MKEAAFIIKYTGKTVVITASTISLMKTANMIRTMFDVYCIAFFALMYCTGSIAYQFTKKK